MISKDLTRFKNILSNKRPSVLHLLISLVFVFLTSSCEAKDPEDVAMFSRTKILNQVNKARLAGQFCGKKWYPATTRLKWNDKLEAAAKVQSEDMLRTNLLSHKGSDNSYVDDRLLNQHYLWKACGENVAYGVLYEDEVVKAWVESEGHCVNIMNPAYTEMGAWVSGLYWTLVLATPEK